MASLGRDAGQAPGTVSAPASAPGAAERAQTLSAEQWIADLDVLAKQLPEKHVKPFTKTTEQEFRAAVAKLRQQIPTLDQAAIVVEFARLAAMLHDAHTSVDTSAFAEAFRRYPFGILPLKDGLSWFVAPAGRPELVGAVMVSIDGMPIEQVIDRVSSLYGWENRATQIAWLRNWINAAEVLRALGVTRSDERAIFEVRTVDGRLEKVELESGKSDPQKLTTADPKWTGVAKTSRRKDARAMWFEMIAAEEMPDSARERRCLYVRYDRCKDDKDKPIAEYCGDLIKRLDEGGIDRIVIDFRYNGGGNSALLDPFLFHLGGRKEFRAKGSVVGMIGPGTFSSAQLNADRLRKVCKAVLVGMPTGQKPNAFGEIRNFELPNSKLKVWYSTKLFHTDDADPESMMPDVVVEPTVADVLSGHDVALERAVAWEPPTKP